MTKERLSKLQRWILTAALADKEHTIPGNRRIAKGFWGEDKVYANCIQLHRHLQPPYRCIGSQFVLSVSRSLRGLLDKGLIQRGLRRANPFKNWLYGPGFCLTDKGEDTALNLMTIGG
jgi:hypothetical protein